MPYTHSFRSKSLRSKLRSLRFNKIITDKEYDRLRKALDNEDALDKIEAEIEDTGAYEQEVNGKTDFLKGITYCEGVIKKYREGVIEKKSEEQGHEI